MLDRIRNPLENFIFICEQYKNDEFDVDILQTAIRFAYLPPESSEEHSITLHNIHEKLELIIYATVGMKEQDRDERRKHAIPLVDALIAATKAELTRLANYTPYATASQLQAT
ncbi:MAG: hypothetical protein FWG65_07825 [Turicibacter sp.]|nr:hypothetical protein [Turicibacter sp.]